MGWPSTEKPNGWGGNKQKPNEQDARSALREPSHGPSPRLEPDMHCPQKKLQDQMSANIAQIPQKRHFEGISLSKSAKSFSLSKIVLKSCMLLKPKHGSCMLLNHEELSSTIGAETLLLGGTPRNSLNWGDDRHGSALTAAPTSASKRCMRSSMKPVLSLLRRPFGGIEGRFGKRTRRAESRHKKEEYRLCTT